MMTKSSVSSLFILAVVAFLWNSVQISFGQSTCTYNAKCDRTVRIRPPCRSIFFPRICKAHDFPCPSGLGEIDWVGLMLLCRAETGHTCVRIVTTNCVLEDQCAESYGSWSVCTVTCGGGTRTRMGTCQGSLCSKSLSQTEPCNTDECPSVPDTGSYDSWSVCTVTCGGGTRTRTGSNNPLSQTEPCNMDECPSVPDTGSYDSWSVCTVTCGGGTRTRTGSNNPLSQTEPCNMDDCPSVPDIVTFGPWSACTVTCGGGSRTRIGSCQGFQCSKSLSQTEPCNMNNCPSVPDINGNWGQWSSWTTVGVCSKSCCTGSQERTRTRACDNPVPSGNGLSCPGEGMDSETFPCNTQLCPVSCAGFPSGQFFDSPCGTCTASFLRCAPGRDFATEFACGAGTVWDQTLLTCVFPNQCSP